MPYTRTNSTRNPTRHEPVKEGRGCCICCYRCFHLRKGHLEDAGDGVVEVEVEVVAERGEGGG